MTLLFQFFSFDFKTYTSMFIQQREKKKTEKERQMQKDKRIFRTHSCSESSVLMLVTTAEVAATFCLVAGVGGTIRRMRSMKYAMYAGRLVEKSRSRVRGGRWREIQGVESTRGWAITHHDPITPSGRGWRWDGVPSLLDNGSSTTAADAVVVVVVSMCAQNSLVPAGPLSILPRSLKNNVQRDRLDQSERWTRNVRDFIYDIFSRFWQFVTVTVCNGLFERRNNLYSSSAHTKSFFFPFHFFLTKEFLRGEFSRISYFKEQYFCNNNILAVIN